MSANDLIQRFERWEKCAFAAFLFLAKVIALSALLVIEVGMAVKVWDIEVGNMGGTNAPQHDTRTRTTVPGR